MDRPRKIGTASAALAAIFWYSGISSHPDCQTLGVTSESVRLTKFLRIDYTVSGCTWYQNASEVYASVLVLFVVAVLVSALALGHAYYSS